MPSTLSIHRANLIAVLVAVFAVGAPVLARAQNGTLKVTSFPTGANVTVDGADTGKVTPMNVSLSIGIHTVVVSIPNSGWNPDTRTVEIVDGNNDLSVTLLPILTVGPPGPNGNSVQVSATQPSSLECPTGGVAYEIADANGNVISGTRRVICTGAIGPQGPAGATGQTGLQGPPGTPAPVPPPPPPAPYGGSGVGFMLGITNPSSGTFDSLDLTSFAGCFDKILGVLYEDCFFTVAGFSPVLTEWIRDTLDPRLGSQFRDLTVTEFETFARRELMVLTIHHAFLSDISVSDADRAAANADGFVRFIAVPATVTSQVPVNMTAGTPPPLTGFRRGLFQVTIDNIDLTGLAAVRGLHVSVPETQILPSPGDPPRVTFQPGSPLQFDNISVEADVTSTNQGTATTITDLQTWVNNVTNGQVDQRNGVLTYKDTTTGAVVLTLNLSMMSPLQFEPFVNANLRRVMQLSLGSFDWIVQ